MVRRGLTPLLFAALTWATLTLSTSAAAPTNPHDDLQELTDPGDKRAQDWASLRGSWGKRDWSQLRGAWGKRDSDDDIRDELAEKRANWDNFKGSWGKRADWNSLHGSWGKRDLPEALQEELQKRSNNWRNLQGMWGKRGEGWSQLRGAWGKRPYPDQLSLEDLLASDDDEMVVRPLKRSWLVTNEKRIHSQKPISPRSTNWSSLRGSWGKRAQNSWSNLRGSWGKRADGAEEDDVESQE